MHRFGTRAETSVTSLRTAIGTIGAASRASRVQLGVGLAGCASQARRLLHLRVERRLVEASQVRAAGELSVEQPVDVRGGSTKSGDQSTSPRSQGCSASSPSRPR